VEYGEQFKIVGNQKQLGNWDAGKGLELTWNEGDVWAATVELPVAVDIEFKVGRQRAFGAHRWWQSWQNTQRGLVLAHSMVEAVAAALTATNCGTTVRARQQLSEGPYHVGSALCKHTSLGATAARTCRWYSTSTQQQQTVLV
jgi:hypothetical protein